MARPLKEDLLGKRFGRLVVTSRAGSDSKSRQALWNCVCDCGVEIVKPGSGLNRGMVNSCGCLVADNNRAIRKTHGLAGTRIYRVWNAMKQRCHNPKQPHYGRYGGRGIRVCDAWRESFEAFHADMGDPPSEEYTLERIDNDGNYEPGNVRWATKQEQAENKRPTSSRGERHPMHKLTDDDVKAIRLSSLGPTAIAKAYGLDTHTVWMIRKRKTWKHVE